MERIAAEPVASFAIGKAGKVGGYLKGGGRILGGTGFERSSPSESG
jgi:hypothetical protein